MKFLLIFFLGSIAFANCFSQEAQKLPPHSKIIFFGDSHTSYGFGIKDNSVLYQNHGYAAWVNALCPDVQIPKGGVLGVAGETTVQMQKRLQTITSFDAKILVVLAGTNDILAGVNPDTTRANLRRIYNKGLAAGMKVIAITILPQFNPPAIKDIVEDYRQRANNWIRSQTDITVIEPEPELSTENWYEDGRHLTPAGAFVLAGKVAAIVNAWVMHCVPGSSSMEVNIAGNQNPFLEGVAGSKIGSSGVVANHWNLASNFAGGAAVAGSKETSAGTGELQVIAISGTYTGSSRRVTLTNDAVPPITLKTGDIIEGLAEVEIPSPLTGIKGIYLTVAANNSDYSKLLAEGNSMAYTYTQSVTLPPGHYVLRTPPMTIGTGGPVASLRTQIVIDFKSTTTAVPVTAKLKISSAGIRRLPLNNGPLAYIAPATQQPLCPGNLLVLRANTVTGGSYQWRVDETDITGQNAANLPVTSPGNYRVKITGLGCAVLSEPVTVVSASAGPSYKFIGNGSWNNLANWLNNNMPPATLPSCAEIIIDPVQNGECIVDAAVYLANGASFKVMKGKKVRVVK